MRARDIEVLPVSLKRERHGHFFTFLDSKPDNDEILSFLLPNPDRLFEFGETIQSAWQSAATDKTVVNLGGKRYFLKRYNCLGVGYRLKNIFRQSRALKSWRASWKYLEMRVPIPQPVCCLEERHLRVLGRSYLLDEMLEDAFSLLDCWLDFNQDQRVHILDQLGSEIGRMHRCGLLHGDLNWRNILVRNMSCGTEVFFVDLDGSRFIRCLSRDLAEKDLSHFFRDLQRNNATDDEIQLFVMAWEKMFLTNDPV